MFFIACTSKEEKAAKLIKNEMYKTLYDFASYEPIETKIDSAFTSVYTDTTIAVYVYLASDYLEKANEFLKEMKDNRSTMEIWSDSYSSYGYSKYKNAKNEYETNLAKTKDYLSKINIISDTIKVMANNIPHKFCGWSATHKFRCKNKGGNFDIGNNLYIISPDFKKNYLFGRFG
jgi:hypothetical protein